MSGRSGAAPGRREQSRPGSASNGCWRGRRPIPRRSPDSPASWTSTSAGGSPIASRTLSTRFCWSSRDWALIPNEINASWPTSPVSGSIGATCRNAYGDSAARVASILCAVGVSPPRTRKSDSAGPGQISASYAARVFAAEPVLFEHPLLEAGHPLDDFGVGQIRRADADVQLPGHPGRVLQLVQPFNRLDVLRRELTDVRHGLDPSAGRPAHDGQSDSHCDYGDRIGASKGQEVLRWAGPVAGGGCLRWMLGIPLPRHPPEGRQHCRSYGHRQAESDGDTDNENPAKPANHGDRRQLQCEEAGNSRKACRADGRSACESHASSTDPASLNRA